MSKAHSLIFAWLTSSFVVFGALAACSSSSSNAVPDEDAGAANDGGAASGDAQARDSEASDSQAPHDAAKNEGGSNADAALGAACTFNHDCVATQRCECDESTGCLCADGARGTGQNGIDPCTSGNDCTRSLCVEGADGGSICSGECGSDADCTGALPMCEDIATIGMICVRKP